LLLPHYLIAQPYYMKGEVKDEAGNLLQNVSIRQLKSGYVFYTGMSGGFGIKTQTSTDSLLFSLDGFQKRTVLANAQAFNTIILKRSIAKTQGLGFKLVSFTHGFKKEEQQLWFTGEESYASTVENGFVPAGKYASTGLSLNVDKASYSNIRRFINTKKQVPPDAVRIEEMINYFNIDYKEPPQGQTFSIHATLSTCPWNETNQLLFARIISKKVSTDKLPPTHLVFLIDVSASMDMDNRMPLLKAGFTGLVNNLRSVDSVSIVVYGGTTAVLMSAVSGGNKQRILNAIDSLQTGGSTPGESGIRLAYSVARKHFIKGGNNRVILATDGDFNVGLRSENDLEEMIVAQREDGIYLTCLGVGMGNYKDSKIQTLAQKGNGNFSYIDNYAEAEKVLIKEFTQTLYTVADDAYLNVHFDPSYVKEYRLLGFDNKAGAIKDTLATIEGGEIGSTYSTLVAFELVPANTLKKENIQLAKFILTYTNSDKKFEEKSEQPLLTVQPFNVIDKPYQFAGGIIMFGSLLKESRFSKTMNWEKVMAIANQSADVNIPSQKEFISLVAQAKELYNKKKKKSIIR
jgi:Ca-activated chloride channel family protein